MDKKGAEMAIGTIVVIILALVVLVVIVYGFTTGWGNLWENLKNFGGGKINVASVVQGCNVACISLAEYDYCTLTRKVIFDETGAKRADNGQSFNCKQLESKNIGLRCENLDCPGDISVSGKTCLNSNGKWQVAKCDLSTQQEVIDLTNDEGKGNNQYCCKTTCESLGGKWSPVICTSNEIAIPFVQISDRTSQGTNTNCCKLR